MKQKLIALLKTSFASKGFNATELEKLADLIIGQHTLTDESADEDLTTAVTNAKPVADFVQSVASRQVSDVKKPKVEESKTTDPAEQKAPEGETPEQKTLRLILEKMEKQDALLAAIQGEKVVNTRRSQYEKALEGTNDKYKAKALKDFDRLTFKDDEDFTSWIESESETAKEFVSVEPQFQSDRPNPAAGPTPGKEKVASADVVDDIINLI
jgi:succinate dehydrogenase flavin-adding protein (antitoxin of CptAB toxin-antitoxin module)